MPALHQFLPALAPRDAIGAHTMKVREVLRAHGVESEIFAGEVHRDLRSEARSYKDWAGGTPMLYHAAIGCALGDWIAHRDEPLLLDYHNITPPEFFEAWNPETGLLLAQGRAQLARVAPRAHAGLADSHYNACELVQFGLSDTTVVPVFIDPSRWGAIDRECRDQLRRTKRGTDWLFVGRLAANKAQHDLVCAFALYRSVWDPGARLWLVGGTSAGPYQIALEGLIERLDLGDSVRLAGSVPPGELGAYFDAADVFVCLSDHEGFCVPVIESMWWGKPVVAYAATAVPETVGDAAVLLEHKDFAAVCAAVDRVAHDRALRDALVERGHGRVDLFAPERTADTLLRALGHAGVLG
ncbi:MAG TPA: glycosyltransferase family 4 protein [Acidimicrobiia bacterium]|jgi:glycosyltransferase involved in cell wall biosynthesis